MPEQIPIPSVPTHTNEVKGLLDACIGILSDSAVEGPTTMEVFSTVSSILALVPGHADNDEMVDDKNHAQLLEYCLNLCEALKITIRGQNEGNLNEPQKGAIKGLERITREIGQTLKKGPGTSQTKRNKFEGHVLKIHQILNALEPTP